MELEFDASNIDLGKLPVATDTMKLNLKGTLGGESDLAFDLTDVKKSTGTLRCVAKSGTNEWVLDPGAMTHEVERACLVARTRVCHGPGYTASNPEVYGMSSAYWSGYSETCADGDPYGYGPATIRERRLYLVSSKCGGVGGPLADCAIGDL